MSLRLTPKNLCGLYPTDILFQTEYWGQVKSRLGWKPLAFDIGASPVRSDVLILIKSLGAGYSAAYVPQGPEFAPSEENFGEQHQPIESGLVAFGDVNRLALHLPDPGIRAFSFRIYAVRRKNGHHAAWKDSKRCAGDKFAIRLYEKEKRTRSFAVG